MNSYQRNVLLYVALINNSIIYPEDKDLALHISSLDMQVKRVQTANYIIEYKYNKYAVLLIKGTRA